MKLPDFDYFEPEDVVTACKLLAQDPEGSAVLAGGTDVLVYLKEGTTRHRRLVSLARIAGLDLIQFQPDSGLGIGAMATVNAVAHHAEIARRYPGIVDAALCLAADQVRNLATVCGNLCMAVPSADMAPILLAFDAQLRVALKRSERLVPLRDFFLGPRQNVLEPGEIVVAIELDPPQSGTGSASLRQGGRVSLSLPIASAAAVVRLEGGVCRQASVALGAVAPTPLLVDGIDALVAGRELDEEVLAEAGELAADTARPIDDHRAPKSYRLELVEVLTRRALLRAAERARS
jgi:carbon-monoxide dehydrogenase medium subunit